MSCRGVLFSRTSGSPPFRSNWDVLGRSSLDCVHPRRLYELEPEVMMVWLEDDFPDFQGCGYSQLPAVNLPGCRLKRLLVLVLCFVVFPRFSTSK